MIARLTGRDRCLAGQMVLALLLCGGLAACGSPTPPATVPASGPAPTVTVPVDLPVVVALGGGFPDQELALLDEMVATFEAANPDIVVEIVAIGGNPDQRRERIAGRLGQGDASVDVYVVDNSWLAGFAANGWLLPLDSHVNAHGVDMDGFLPPAVQAATIGGRLVALPWTVDGGVLYYRADLLDRYGDRPPADWAGLQRLALDVKARAGLPYGFVWQGAAYETLTCNTLEFVWAHGGEVLDGAGAATFDSPQTRAALAQMREMITSGASPQDVVAYNEAKSLAIFENGEALFLRHWASRWSLLQAADSPLAGRVGVAPLPASCLAGHSLALSALSHYPDQAFRLVSFLAGYDQQVRWAQATGLLPALAAAYRADPALGALVAALSTARPLPQTAAYPAISEAIYLQTNKLLAGDQDVDTTAAQIQQSIQAAIDQP